MRVAHPTEVPRPHSSAEEAVGASLRKPALLIPATSPCSSQNPSRPPRHFLRLHFPEPEVTAVSEGRAHLSGLLVWAGSGMLTKAGELAWPPEEGEWSHTLPLTGTV